MRMLAPPARHVVAVRVKFLVHDRRRKQTCRSTASMELAFTIIASALRISATCAINGSHLLSTQDLRKETYKHLQSVQSWVGVFTDGPAMCSALYPRGNDVELSAGPTFTCCCYGVGLFNNNFISNAKTPHHQFTNEMSSCCRNSRRFQRHIKFK
jgi:hypothetical protein